MAENGYGAVNATELATLSLLNGGLGGIGVGGGHGVGFSSATFGSDTVLEKGLDQNRGILEFQFNAAQRIETEARNADRFIAIAQQIVDARAEAAECCCETKLAIADLKADVRLLDSNQSKLFLEQNSRMDQAKISSLETQLAILAAQCGSNGGGS